MNEPIIASGIRKVVRRISINPTLSVPIVSEMPSDGMIEMPASAGCIEPSLQPGNDHANASETTNAARLPKVAIHFAVREGASDTAAAAAMGTRRRREVRAGSIVRSECQLHVECGVFVCVFVVELVAE